MKCFYPDTLVGRCAASIVAKYNSNYEHENFICFKNKIDFCNIKNKIENKETIYIFNYTLNVKNLKDIEYLLKLKECEIYWINDFNSIIHKDNIDKLCNTYPHLHIINNVNHSIVYSCWTLLFPIETIPSAVKYLDEYEKGIKKSNQCRFFKLGMSVTNNNFDSDKWVVLLNEWVLLNELSYRNTLTGILNAGESIEKYIKKQSEYILKQMAFSTTIFGYSCLAINTKPNKVLADVALSNHLLCCFFINKQNKWYYTIYSNNPNIDCLKLTKSFDGYGNNNKATFIVDEPIKFKEIEKK